MSHDADQPNPENAHDNADTGAAHLAPPAGNPIQAPPGGQLLTADEAIDLLVIGDHPETGRGDIALDAALIDGLRAGWLIAYRMPDDRIAFTRTDTQPPAPTPRQ